MDKSAPRPILARLAMGIAAAMVATLLPAVPARATSTQEDEHSVRIEIAAQRGQQGFGWRVPHRGNGVHFANAGDAHRAATVITIDSAAAASTFEFPLTIPSGDSLQETADGGFDVVHDVGGGVGITIGHLDAPWARDAVGRPLPTAFRLHGETLVQAVDTGSATFPVVADPKITWGWVTGTIYFSRQETASIAVYGASSGFFAALVPGWGYALSAYASVLVTAANKARASNQCLKVKIPTLVPQSYSGGYCH